MVTTAPNMNVAMLKLSQYTAQRQGKLTQLSLRRAFVWTPSVDGADGARPAPYATLSSRARAGGLRPKLYLLLRWLAATAQQDEDGTTTYRTTRDLDQLCLWLGRCGPQGAPNAEDRKAILKALRALESLQLIDLTRRSEGWGREVVVDLRHELTGSTPFVPPHQTASRDSPDFDGGYFSLPHQLITQGWLTWLPPNALHLLLHAAHRHGATGGTVGLPDTVRSARNIIPHSEDLAVAGCILKAVGLVQVTEPSQTNQRVRLYELLPHGLRTQAPRTPLELYRNSKRVTVHGDAGIREQLADLDIHVTWPRPSSARDEG